MNQKAIIMIIILLSLVAGFAYIYWKYELPNRNKLSDEFVNFSIVALDKGERVKTQIKITGVDEPILINTSDTFELIRIRNKQNITIVNQNIDNQNYYTTPFVFDLNSTQNVRYEFILSKPEKIFVEFDESNPIEVRVSSNYLKDPKFCLKWTSAYIFVEALNYSEIEKIKGYESYGRCYEFKNDILDTTEIIKVSYKIFSEVQKSDKIEIIIIDPNFLTKNDKTITIK